MADDDVSDLDSELPDDLTDADEDAAGAEDPTAAASVVGSSDNDIQFLDDANFINSDEDNQPSGGGLKRWLIIGGSLAAGIIVIGIAIVFLFSGGHERTKPVAGVPVVSLKIIPKRPLPAPALSPTDVGLTVPIVSLNLGPEKPLTTSALTPPAGVQETAPIATRSLNDAVAAVTTPRATLNNSSANSQRGAASAAVIVSAVEATAYANTPPPPKSKPLAAPDTGLIENTTEGALPQIAPDGRQPWQVYKAPFTLNEGQSPVAVIVHGLGLSQTTTIAAIDKLPAEVTLAFNIYAKGLRNWMSSARAQGHETLLSLPMQPNNFPISDPGPRALKTDLEAEENVLRLRQILALAAGYVGVMNFLGSQFVTSEEALRPVLKTLRSRGLMYVDNGLVPGSKVAPIARAIGLPWARSNMVIDAEASRTGINRQLRALELRAQQGQAAIGIAEPYPVTIRQISTWLPTLASKKLVLAPASAVARVGAN